MKIRTFKTLQNDIYNVTIRTEDWSQSDTLLMQKFAEPEIDLGGTFDDGYTLTFTLPNNLVRILSDSPFTYGFDGRDFVDAEARAQLWATSIAARIEAAVLAMRQLADSYTSETVETV